MSFPRMFAGVLAASSIAAIASPEGLRAQASSPQANACSAATLRRAPSSRAQWTRWGGDVHNTRIVANSADALTAADLPKLTLRWSYNLGAIANARSQVAVASGRVFAGSEAGTVAALDLESGCSVWTVQLTQTVRTSLVLDVDGTGAPKTVYFGDVGANLHALDAATGATRWSVHVDDHTAALITGAPQLYRGVLYVGVSSYESLLPLQPTYPCCSFRGSVVAVDATTGKVLWKTYTIDVAAAPTTTSKSGAALQGPSGAAVWSTPSVDEKLDRIYFGTGNNYSEPTTNRSDAIVALDRRTGAVVWSKQFAKADGYNLSCDVPGKYNCPASDGPDHDFGQAPILVTLSNGQRALVVGQKAGVLRALDPDHDGAVLWERTLGPGGRLGGLHWGSASDGRRVYAAYGGQTIDPVADSTAPGGYRLVANSKAGGGLFAVDALNGSVVWSAKPPVCDARPGCSPAQSAAVTVGNGLVFSGALDGHIRAYDANTGRVVWNEDTAVAFTAVNGGAAHGGSLDGGGPVLVGRNVIFGSGYALNGGMAGNVLLVFGVPRGK
ncbi:MAG: PQQ-binding-like beta-propeller repeat protein [bacterium]